MSGTCVSASPANATIPIRSDVRRAMNCLTVAFATSIRLFGLKSSASIELDKSIAITMLMPSLVCVSTCAPERGRASATMKRSRARDFAAGKSPWESSSRRAGRSRGPTCARTRSRPCGGVAARSTTPEAAAAATALPACRNRTARRRSRCPPFRQRQSASPHRIPG